MQIEFVYGHPALYKASPDENCWSPHFQCMVSNVCENCVCVSTNKIKLIIKGKLTHIGPEVVKILMKCTRLD